MNFDDLSELCTERKASGLFQGLNALVHQACSHTYQHKTYPHV